MKDYSLKEFASLFDHTNLKPDATKLEIEKLCREALHYNFGAVCINPSNIQLAKRMLNGSDVKICTVIGFPLGATTSETKAFETKQAVDYGATEIDMVLNIGVMKNGDAHEVQDDIKSVVDASDGNLVKVILETCFLEDDEVMKACELSMKAGADFVKTSTGFGTEGATLHHVRLMRKTVGDKMGVKASGGIRNFKTARQMIEAGANRIGASASIAILNEYEKKMLKKGTG